MECKFGPKDEVRGLGYNKRFQVGVPVVGYGGGKMFNIIIKGGVPLTRLLG